MRCPCCQQPVPDDLGLVVSLESNTAAARGQCVKLQPDKAVIAYALAGVAPGAITYEKLFDALWGYDSPLTASSILKSHVSQLRHALEPLGYGVVTVWKYGYRLVDKRPAVVIHDPLTIAGRNGAIPKPSDRRIA